MKFIQAAVCLHDYLLTEEASFATDRVDQELTDGTVALGQWRTETARNTGVRDIGRLGSNMSSLAVRRLQDKMADFLVSPQGSVPWQSHMVLRV